MANAQNPPVVNALCRFIRRIPQACKAYYRDTLTERSAALAYHAMFSFFPLLLLLISGLGLFLRRTLRGQSAKEALIKWVIERFSIEIGSSVSQLLGTLQKRAISASGLGFLILIWAASRIFHELQTGLDLIFSRYLTPQPLSAHDIPKGQSVRFASLWRWVKKNSWAVLMVLACGLFAVISIAMTGAVQALTNKAYVVPILGRLLSLALGQIFAFGSSVAALLLIYRYSSSLLRPSWNAALNGALASGLLWEVGKRILAYYLRNISVIGGYGIVGTVLILMLWVDLSSRVLFFGAHWVGLVHAEQSAPPNRCD